MAVPAVDSDPVLAEMVRRLVAEADPDRIILFGSRARGEGSPDSDYDLLVVGPSPLPRWKRTVPLYRALAGLGVPKDILWWTPEEAAEWQGVRSHVVTQATRDGTVVYERGGSSA